MEIKLEFNNKLNNKSFVEKCPRGDNVDQETKVKAMMIYENDIRNNLINALNRFSK